MNQARQQSMQDMCIALKEIRAQKQQGLAEIPNSS